MITSRLSEINVLTTVISPNSNIISDASCMSWVSVDWTRIGPTVGRLSTTNTITLPELAPSRPGFQSRL